MFLYFNFTGGYSNSYKDLVCKLSEVLDFLLKVREPIVGLLLDLYNYYCLPRSSFTRWSILRIQWWRTTGSRMISCFFSNNLLQFTHNFVQQRKEVGCLFVISDGIKRENVVYIWRNLLLAVGTLPDQCCQSHLMTDASFFSNW